jgi:phosphotransferase system HPr (HPr) family protein
MASKMVTIVADSGMHARAGRAFVKSVLDHHGCAVTVRKGDLVVDARSTVSIMAMDCSPNDQIEIIVEGGDAERALADLARVVEHDLRAY